MSDLGQRRHLSRERALEILYEANVKNRTIDAVLGELAVTPDDFTTMLVRAADVHRARAEELISENSAEWALDRIAVIDRLIMTMAIAELLSDETTPRAVVLDEAVELAKMYSTENSASFVNGVLAACVVNIE